MPLDRERYEVVYPAGGSHFSRTPPPGSFISRVLLPASLVYAGASELVRRARVRDRTKTGDAVVISVGNPRSAETGRPFRGVSRERARAPRYRPAYASRGFRSEAEDIGGATVLVRRSAEPVGSCPAGRAHTEERCAGVERSDRRRRGDGGVTVSGRAACV